MRAAKSGGFDRCRVRFVDGSIVVVLPTRTSVSCTGGFSDEPDRTNGRRWSVDPRSASEPLRSLRGHGNHLRTGRPVSENFLLELRRYLDL
jgi:hypothetical protein